MWKPMGLAAIVAGALLLFPAGVLADSGHAAAKTTDQRPGAQRQKEMDKLRHTAGRYGIDPAGKSADQLMSAVRERRMELDRLKAAQTLRSLRDQAARLGIRAKGKTAREIRLEIRARQMAVKRW